jgi:hypothetical protein
MHFTTHCFLVLQALQKIVTDGNLLKALPHMTLYCHTGNLEIFHSMLLKYCPKRLHFRYEGKAITNAKHIVKRR